MTRHQRFAAQAHRTHGRTGRRLTFESLDARLALSIGPAPSLDYAFDRPFDARPMADGDFHSPRETDMRGIDASGRFDPPQRGFPLRDVGFDYGGGPFVAMPPGGWIVIVVVPSAQPAQTSHDTTNTRPMASDDSRSDVSLAALAQSIPQAAQSTSTSAGNPARFTTIESIGLASLFANAAAATQDIARTFDASATTSWMPAPRFDDSASRESSPAVDAMMEPLAADSDTEGGLIQLDGAQGDERATPDRHDHETDAAPRSVDADDLDAFWSDWLDNEEREKEAPTLSTADTTDHVAEALSDSEGGLIELSTPAAAVDEPQAAYVLHEAERVDADPPPAFEAGVALFQAFELGNEPAETPGGAESVPAPPPAAESGAVEQSKQSASGSAAAVGLLAAVPLELRRRRAKARPPHPPTR